MPCSLVVLIHVRLITINTMDLDIITSSHLTHVGLHGSIVMWVTFILRCYKAIIRRVSGLLIPIPIGLIFFSILWSIRMSMRSYIRCSRGCTMRWYIVRYMGSSMIWKLRRSRNRYMTCWHNRRNLDLWYYSVRSRRVVAVFWPEAPRELGGGWVVKKAFEGMGFEDDETCEGM